MGFKFDSGEDGGFSYYLVNWRIAQGTRRDLERQGLLQRDAKISHLAGELIDEESMDPLWGHSFT